MNGGAAAVPGERRNKVAEATQIAKLASMKTISLAVFVLTLFAALPAAADCTDPPDPGVNWQGCNFNGLTLTELDLEGGRLREASFLRSDISDSNLRDIEGYKARFVSAKLRNVDFESAQLARADFTKADMTGANLTEADLRNARLYQTILREADLTGAKLGGADLADADLSGATWIDGERTCREGSIGRCF